MSRRMNDEGLARRESGKERLTDNGDEYQKTEHQCPEDDRGVGEYQTIRGRVSTLVDVFLHDVRDI